MTTIPDIDTDVIDSLKEIRDQQSVLEERLAQMEAKKESVSEVVYERVQGDYRSRLAELEETARPLEDEARGEWARLQQVFQRIQELQAEARLEREELEFRHDLGEFGDDEFDAQVETIEERLAAHEGEIETMESMRRSFVEAFGSEERLQAAPPPAAVREEEAFGHDAEEASEDVSSETRPSEAFEVPPVPLPDIPPALEEDVEATTSEKELPAPPEEVTDGMTGEVVAEGAEGAEEAEDVTEGPAFEEATEQTTVGETTEQTTIGETLPSVDEATRMHTSPGEPLDDLPLHDDEPGPDAGATRVMTPGIPAPEGEGAEVTRILKKPRLETVEDEGVGESFILGALPVTIGRSSDNTIHLLEEAVSRHHAELIPGPDGFLLRDLGSENGSFVNGKRKKEHLLRDGDLVQIGLRKMAFRET
jgi:hypothetical protein